MQKFIIPAVALVLAGCLSGESDGSGDGNAFQPQPPAAGNSAPSISGTPPTSVMVTNNYSFTPTASDPDGDSLTFSVAGLPAWAEFDAASGRISGTPMGGDEDTYQNIMITVSDGVSSDSLTPFDIEVLPFGSPPPPPPANSAPTISGTPQSTVTVGAAYSFMPTASDPDGDSLSFSVNGLPGWASFNMSNGTLSGTPQPGDENVYGNIVIRVSDGALTDSLGPFSIEVTSSGTATGSAALSWTPPTENEDGTPLVDLAGYKVYWTITPGSYPNSFTIENASVTNYTVEGLTAGTWEFVVTAFNEARVESSFSVPATKVIQ